MMWPLGRWAEPRTALPRRGKVQLVSGDAAHRAEFAAVERDVDLGSEQLGLGLAVPLHLAGLVADQVRDRVHLRIRDLLEPLEHRGTLLEGQSRPRRKCLASSGDRGIDVRDIAAPGPHHRTRTSGVTRFERRAAGGNNEAARDQVAGRVRKRSVLHALAAFARLVDLDGLPDLLDLADFLEA
jgi:hypothetical protein